MSVEWGNFAPFLDNWPITRQLWTNPAKTPGTELDLTAPGRNLVVQWREPSTNTVVLAYTENNPAVKIDNLKRGVVSVRLSGNDWTLLKARTSYSLEIIAYGFLYSTSEFNTGVPSANVIPLVGGNIYASPRQIIALLSVAAATATTSEDLSGGWTLNPLGYWTKTTATQINGLWVNDHNIRLVPYSELATSGDRVFSVVGQTLYYKGPDNLTDAYVETAYNFLTLQALQRASDEVERRTGRFFNKRLVIREIQRGTRFQWQLLPKQYPLHLNEFFRLDVLTRGLILYRRYTERAFTYGSTPASQSQSLTLNPETGAITFAANLWDILDWGGGDNGAYGISTIPKGENNVELTYVAGFDTLPALLGQAASNIASIQLGRFWQQQISQGFDGLSIGCVNVNFSQLFKQYFPDWSSEADQILGNYQRIDVDAI